MRNLINTLLACLILACPFVCGAAEVGHNAGHQHAGSGPSPAHCPENSDNCVCRGAVQPGQIRAGDPHVETSAPLFILAPALSLPERLHHFAAEGSAAGLASWGGPRTMRALLQNFRF